MRKWMRKLAMFVIAGTLLPAWLALAQAPGTSDEAAVRQAVEAYFKALENRDIEALKQVIHPSTIFASVTREGKLEEMSQERWHALIRPTEKDSAKYEITGAIQSVDVTGSTASVKSTIEFPRYVFHEYIAMAKIEGRWMMVHKVYVLKGKPRA